MKVVILAAGFGTRLQRDIMESRDHKELLNKPKPLLPVSGKPVISHWMEMLDACPETKGQVALIANDANYGEFEKWRRNYPDVTLVSSGAVSNDTRPGAVACIEIPVRELGIHDHLLVIGGDTLLYEDFSLPDFLSAFHQSPAIAAEGAFIPYYICPDEDTSKRGILELDEAGKVVSFLEKPQPTETTSRKASPCIYLFTRGSLPLLSQFMEEKKHAPMKEKDATGNFVKYLCSRRPVYTYKISGRYDIGGLDSYLHCCSNYCPPRNGYQTK